MTTRFEGRFLNQMQSTTRISDKIADSQVESVALKCFAPAPFQDFRCVLEAGIAIKDKHSFRARAEPPPPRKYSVGRRLKRRKPCHIPSAPQISKSTEGAAFL